MKAFSHINIGEKISFIIGCKNYRILVVSKKTDKHLCNLHKFYTSIRIGWKKNPQLADKYF